MSKTELRKELYSLVSQMTVLNGYNFDWSSVKSLKNGAFICDKTAKLHIKLEKERNNDAVNGVGNNFQQIIIPMEISFGKNLSSPSGGLESSETELEELSDKMIRDISKMYSSPYKIDKTKVPEYCGTEYTDEGEVDTSKLDAHTQFGKMLFDITYKRNREINA
jgi:hypothetical protein